MLALVVGIEQRAVFVNDGKFDGSGTNVNTKHKVGISQVNRLRRSKLRSVVYELDLLVIHYYSLQEPTLPKQNGGYPT